MRPILTIAPPLLGRMMCAAGQLPPDRARALVGALLAGDAVTPDAGTLSAQYYARRLPTIRAMHRAIRRQLRYALHETLRNIEEAGHRSGRPLKAAEGDDDPTGAGGVAADLAFDPERFATGLLATLRNESAQGLQTAGNQLFAELGSDAPDDPFKLPDPLALRYLDERENLLKGIPDEIHAQIMETLQEGLTEGDSTRALASRITATFGQIGRGHTLTIASTETAAAYGFARQQGMAQAGIQFKRWLTSHLKNVRAAHAAAERDPRNQRVPMDEPFHVGGENLMFPGDPAGSAGNVINCHCVSLAVTR